MKNLLILHGLGGNPEINWYKYIAKNLESRGYLSWIPQLPNADEPNLELTYELISKANFLNNKTTIVGHSSGAVLTLGILQKLPENTKVDKVFLISCFIDPYLTDELHKYVSRDDYADLFPEKWNWEKIKNSANKFIIIYSPSDPFVQTRHTNLLKEKVDGKAVLINGAKHFSVTSGGERFKEFPELLHMITE